MDVRFIEYLVRLDKKRKIFVSAQVRKMAIMSIARTVDWLNVRRDGVNLFLIGFLILFLELACIRWFSANVIFLQFFTNIVLIACFLGMSCGGPEALGLACLVSLSGARNFRGRAHDYVAV